MSNFYCMMMVVCLCGRGREVNITSRQMFVFPPFGQIWRWTEMMMIAMEMSFFIVKCPLVDPGNIIKYWHWWNVQKKYGTKMTNMTLCPKIKFGRERIMIAMEMSFFILRCPLADPGNIVKCWQYEMLKEKMALKWPQSTTMGLARIDQVKYTKWILPIVKIIAHIIWALKQRPKL